MRANLVDELQRGLRDSSVENFIVLITILKDAKANLKIAHVVKAFKSFSHHTLINL